MIIAKEKQAKETEAKKQHQTWMKIWRMERDAKYAEGVIARKQERNRLQQIKELSKQDLTISSKHLIPIRDPEAIWKATDDTWQEEERKKAKRTKSQVYNEDEDEDEAETIFITDITGDSSLQRDFLPFDEDDTNRCNESDNDLQEQLGYYYVSALY